MKRIVTAMAVLIAAAGMLSAGEVSVALESKANIWSQTVDASSKTKTQGFNIVQGDDYVSQLQLGYDTDFGGGFVRFRLEDITKGNKNLYLHRWNMYIKPVQQVKFSIGTSPYEVFAESINWEPIFGAGFFEDCKPNAVLELFPVKGLTIMGGLSAQDEETGAYGATDNPFDTFEGVVKYDIDGIGSVAVEYSGASLNLLWHDSFGTDASSNQIYAADYGFKNGDIKRIGAQFNYTGVPKLSVLAGYSAVIASGDGFKKVNDTLKAANKTELSALAQNRFELFAVYSGIDKLTLSVYDAALVRGTGWGDFGNRLAVKAAYQATDKLSFWTRENVFTNYGPQGWGTHGGTLAWGEYQLGNTRKDQALLRAELFANYDFGKGVGAYAGVRIDHDLSNGDADVDNDYRTAYNIPVGITINY